MRAQPGQNYNVYFDGGRIAMAAPLVHEGLEVCFELCHKRYRVCVCVHCVCLRARVVLLLVVWGHEAGACSFTLSGVRLLVRMLTCVTALYSRDARINVSDGTLFYL